MIIENVNINNTIDCDEIRVELTGYASSMQEAMEMNKFMGEDLVYCDEECCCEEFAEPMFGGAYYCPCCGELIYIEKVIYSKPAVIIIWSDGTKTKSTCDKEDIWNPELGLTLCVLKKTQGQNFVSKLLRDWSVEYTGADIASDEKLAAKTITLKDVRRNLRDFSDAKDFVDKVTNK